MNKLYRLHTKWPQRKARVSREKKDLVFLIDPFQCWFIQHQLVSSSSIQNYKPHSVLKSNKLVYSCIHFLAPRQNPGTNAFRHLFQCLTTSPCNANIACINYIFEVDPCPWTRMTLSLNLFHFMNGIYCLKYQIVCCYKTLMSLLHLKIYLLHY